MKMLKLPVNVGLINKVVIMKKIMSIMRVAVGVTAIYIVE
jgi:hypothetical protein